jgi:hypothetical protein
VWAFCSASLSCRAAAEGERPPRPPMPARRARVRPDSLRELPHARSHRSTGYGGTEADPTLTRRRDRRAVDRNGRRRDAPLPATADEFADPAVGRVRSARLAVKRAPRATSACSWTSRWQSCKPCSTSGCCQELTTASAPVRVDTGLARGRPPTGCALRREPGQESARMFRLLAHPPIR